MRNSASKVVAQPQSPGDLPFWVPEEIWVVIGSFFSSWGDVAAMMMVCRQNFIWWSKNTYPMWLRREVLWREVRPMFPGLMDPACSFGAYCMCCMAPFGSKKHDENEQRHVFIVSTVFPWRVFVKMMGVESCDWGYSLDMEEAMDHARDIYVEGDGGSSAADNTFVKLAISACSEPCARWIANTYVRFFPKCTMCSKELDPKRLEQHFEAECPCRVCNNCGKNYRCIEANEIVKVAADNVDHSAGTRATKKALMGNPALGDKIKVCVFSLYLTVRGVSV